MDEPIFLPDLPDIDIDEMSHASSLPRPARRLAPRKRSADAYSTVVTGFLPSSTPSNSPILLNFGRANNAGSPLAVYPTLRPKKSSHWVSDVPDLYPRVGEAMREDFATAEDGISIAPSTPTSMVRPRPTKAPRLARNVGHVSGGAELRLQDGPLPTRLFLPEF